MTLALFPMWRLTALAAVLTGLTGLTSCSALLPKPAAPMVIYAIDGAGLAPAPSASPAAPPSAAPAINPTPVRLTLLVQVLHAAPGFDSSRIVYTRQPHRIESYSQSEWVDTPARMLAPLLVAALERQGSFAAVAMAPSAAAGDLRLDVEIVHLAQSFATLPSRVHLSLRASLIDSGNRRVLATRVIETSAPAPSDDAAGGVRAANQAAHTALQQLAEFCSQVAALRVESNRPGVAQRLP